MCETHALASYVPNAIIMFEKASSDEFQAIKRIDQSLAKRRVVRKRPYAELTAWDSEVEGFSALRGEANIDHRRK